MTQRALALQLGIHFNYLNLVLKGHRRPSIALAIKIEEMSEGRYRATKLRPDMRQTFKKMAGVI